MAGDEGDVRDTVKLSVRLFGRLAEGPGARPEVELDEGSTVGDIVTLLGLAGSGIVVFAAGERVTFERRLVDGETLDVIQAVAGGCSWGS